MTHGEAWFAAARSEELLLTKEGYTREVSGLPKKMSRTDATIYYSSKLFEYWEAALEVKEKYRKKALALMMFRTTEAKNLKLKKEFIDEITSPVKSK